MLMTDDCGDDGECFITDEVLGNAWTMELGWGAGASDTGPGIGSLVLHTSPRAKTRNTIAFLTFLSGRGFG